MAFDMENNGELRVMKLLGVIDPRCVYDVGANRGEWSRLMADLYPSCQIHAFEILPSTYAELLLATESSPNIVANNFGLSEEEGSMSISYSDRDSTTATACKIEGMRFHEQYYTRKMQCMVRKASNYMAEKKITSIDFLKVDVEGMELKVIKGFGDKLGCVRVVQFEYGIFNISSHDLLYDLCKLLTESGFVVGKIFPKSVCFFEYHFDKENFRGSNYLAVRKEEKQLISVLSRYGT